MPRSKIIPRKLKKLTVELPVFCSQVLDRYIQFIREEQGTNDITVDDLIATMVEELADEKSFKDWEKAQVEKRRSGAKLANGQTKISGKHSENTAGQ